MTNDNSVQAQVLSSNECTVLETIGARMLDAMWPKGYTYHTQAGVNIKFEFPEKEEEKK